MKTFNDRWLSTVKPGDGGPNYSDAGCPHLAVRIGKRRKTFSVWVGPKSARRQITIGQYPDMSLRDARAKADDLANDPRVAGGGKPSESARRKLGSVKELFESVVQAMRDEGKADGTIKDYELYLLTGKISACSDFGPATPAGRVTTEMVTSWLSKYDERGSSTRLPRAIVSAAFKRGIKADNDPRMYRNTRVKFAIPFNPVANVGGETQSKARDRCLTLDELKAFWSDLSGPAFTPQVAVLAKMLIAMGGVRVTEVCRSRHDWWIDDGDWKTLSAGMLDLPKTKNGHPHRLPVTRIGEDILADARAFQKIDNLHLFPSPRRSGRPRSFETLTRAVHDYCDEADFERFTPRDIRRTMKTLILDMDVPQADVDIWHNHGKNADVARRNYDRAQYEQAKGRVRDAIDALLEGCAR